MTKIIDGINSPSDIKGLTIKQLEGLAEEIREFIIASVNETGGHLASSLGMVDVTLALHTVFESPPR